MKIVFVAKLDSNFSYLLKMCCSCCGEYFIMDQVMQYVEPAKQFAKDSIRLVKRCTKPDRKGNKHQLIFFFRMFIIIHIIIQL